MADVNKGNRQVAQNRPMSPFMLGTYYRFQLTALTSILTRITGNGLIVPAALIVAWFLAAAMGPEAFACVNGFLTSWFGDIIMFLSLAAMWYHLLAGLRHIWWDNTARGMDIQTAYRIGYAMFAGTAVLTILTAIVL